MRDLVISTKFQWIPLQIVHFPNFRYKCRTISNEEKSYKSKYLFLRFSKCNETSPKLVYFKETQRYSDAWKNSTASNEKCKGSESRQLEHM